MRQNPVQRTMVAGLITYLAWWFALELTGMQVSAILALMEKDLLALLPTGSGKTLCMWAFSDRILNGDPRGLQRIPMDNPAFVRPILIVISPLLNLMKSQCTAFNLLHGATVTGTFATFINQDQTDEAILSGFHTGRTPFSVIYMTAEGATGVWAYLFQMVHFKKRIVALAVDEAHCIIHWGASFRTAYARLFEVRQELGLRVPCITLSATLTPVEQIMYRTTCLAECACVGAASESVACTSSPCALPPPRLSSFTCCALLVMCSQAKYFSGRQNL